MSGRLHINVNILNARVFGGSWRFPGTDGLASCSIDRDRLDAVELVPTGGIDGVLAAVRTLVPLLSASTGPTLRASLGLRDTVEALS